MQLVRICELCKRDEATEIFCDHHFCHKCMMIASWRASYKTSPMMHTLLYGRTFGDFLYRMN
jgi:hypothetical protein